MLVLRKLFSKDHDKKDKKDKKNDREKERDLERRLKSNRFRNGEVNLADLETNRGLGRAALIGSLPAAVSLPGTLAGGYFGKNAALKYADEGGHTDEEIRSKARNVAALIGGGTGALGGLAAGLYKGSGKPLVNLAKKSGGARMAKWGTAGAIAGGALGALGAALGADKNIEERIRLRNKIEREMLLKEIDNLSDKKK